MAVCFRFQLRVFVRSLYLQAGQWKRRLTKLNKGIPPNRTRTNELLLEHVFTKERFEAFYCNDSRGQGTNHQRRSAFLLRARVTRFFFIPGQLGAADAGIVAGIAALGLPASVGLAIALVRRGREVVVFAAGLVSLAFVESAPSTHASRGPDSSATAAPVDSHAAG